MTGCVEIVGGAVQREDSLGIDLIIDRCDFKSDMTCSQLNSEGQLTMLNMLYTFSTPHYL